MESTNNGYSIFMVFQRLIFRVLKTVNIERSN